MDLDPYLARVAEQLAAAAALGDDRTRAIAATLADAAGAAVRVALLDALTAAGREVTDALHAAAGDGNQPAPAVTLLLDDGQPRFTVTMPPAEQNGTEPPRADDGDATARISLRLSESLKAEVERAAGAAGVSVNSWLVRAAGAALRPPAQTGWHAPGGHRITGWVTG